MPGLKKLLDLAASKKHHSIWKVAGKNKNLQCWNSPSVPRYDGFALRFCDAKTHDLSCILANRAYALQLDVVFDLVVPLDQID